MPIAGVILLRAQMLRFLPDLPVAGHAQHPSLHPRLALSLTPARSTALPHVRMLWQEYFARSLGDVASAIGFVVPRQWYSYWVTAE